MPGRVVQARVKEQQTQQKLVNLKRVVAIGGGILLVVVAWALLMASPRTGGLQGVQPRSCTCPQPPAAPVHGSWTLASIRPADGSSRCCMQCQHQLHPCVAQQSMPQQGPNPAVFCCHQPSLLLTAEERMARLDFGDVDTGPLPDAAAPSTPRASAGSKDVPKPPAAAAAPGSSSKPHSKPGDSPTAPAAGTAATETEEAEGTEEQPPAALEASPLPAQPKQPASPAPAEEENPEDKELEQEIEREKELQQQEGKEIEQEDAKVRAARTPARTAFSCHCSGRHLLAHACQDHVSCTWIACPFPLPCPCYSCCTINLGACAGLRIEPVRLHTLFCC